MIKIQENCILEIRNLNVQFKTRSGNVNAVRDVGFSIAEGETLGIVGESGCGKSVTALSILRALPRNALIVKGEILYRKKNAKSETIIPIHSLNERGTTIRSIRGKEIALIYQEPMLSLSPVHTIGNQIIEAIRLHNDISRESAKDQAIQMLDYVGIPKPADRINHFTFELSGGMRQRAMIAMALSCRPRIVIADEPTTALDVTIQAQILKLIHRIQEENRMSMILITHDFGVISTVTNKVVVMYLGHIVEGGRTKEVISNPKHPYTIALIKAIPQPRKGRKKPLYAIKGTVPGATQEIKGCAFHPRCELYVPGLCDTEPPEKVIVSSDHFHYCSCVNDATATSGF